MRHTTPPPPPDTHPHCSHYFEHQGLLWETCPHTQGGRTDQDSRQQGIWCLAQVGSPHAWTQQPEEPLRLVPSLKPSGPLASSHGAHLREGGGGDGDASQSCCLVSKAMRRSGCSSQQGHPSAPEPLKKGRGSSCRPHPWHPSSPLHQDLLSIHSLLQAGASPVSCRSAQGRHCSGTQGLSHKLFPVSRHQCQEWNRMRNSPAQLPPRPADVGAVPDLG